VKPRGNTAASSAWSSKGRAYICTAKRRHLHGRTDIASGTNRLTPPIRRQEGVGNAVGMTIGKETWEDYKTKNASSLRYEQGSDATPMLRVGTFSQVAVRYS
jgi:hypothetical protein